MNGKVYVVFLDGWFVGLADNEFETWEVADVHTYGTGRPLLDDDVDRVDYSKIDVNQWTVCENAMKNAENKITGESILCASTIEAQKAVDILNKLALIKEREEAKKRAMAL